VSVVDDVKARADILEVMQSYGVTVNKAGKNYKALCPFHQEKTPSFVVWPETGTWRCFGACGDGGDVFGFVMKQENIDFGASLKLLAERVGVELTPRTPAQSEKDTYLDRLRGLLNETARFFYEQLTRTAEASEIRLYVERRGLTPVTVERFGIGYAPGGWRHAIDHLLELDYTVADLVEAGIAIRSEKDPNRIYERFRNRLIIPIRDARGAVVGFGARAMSDADNPKYLNSPQTPLFDKSSLLFGMDTARRAIRESEVAVIVEGYMDAIQAQQAGFENVVAQMGTALSPAQLAQLVRYAKRIVLALDPDSAGATATLRELSLARQQLSSYKVGFDPHSSTMRQMSQLREVDLRVLTVPDGLDPDDLIREQPDRWPPLVEQAQPLTDYVLDQRTAHIASTTPLADREALARALIPELLDSDLNQHRIVQEVALRLHVNERDLMAYAQRQRRETTRSQPASATQQRSLSRSIEQNSVQGDAANQFSHSPANVPANQNQPRSVGSAVISASDDAQGLSMEGYCLAALIEQPRLWAVINRYLGQVCAAGKGKFDLWLGPLTADDFSHPTCRIVFDTLRQALNQDQLAPLDYLHQTLAADLSDAMDRMLAGPLAAIVPAGTWQRFEVNAIQAGKRKGLSAQGQASDTETEFVEKALYLRRRRLQEIFQQLYYAQMEGLDSPTVRIQLSQCRQATGAIDEAVVQLQQARSRLMS